jgi:hypothetical protein
MRCEAQESDVRVSAGRGARPAPILMLLAKYYLPYRLALERREPLASQRGAVRP